MKDEVKYREYKTLQPFDDFDGRIKIIRLYEGKKIIGEIGIHLDEPIDDIFDHNSNETTRHDNSYHHQQQHLR